MAYRRISKRAVMAYAAAAVILVAGLGVIAYLVFADDAVKTPPKSAYAQCVDEAFEYVRSTSKLYEQGGLSDEQARLQAETSPRCSALAPVNQVAPATDTLGITLNTPWSELPLLSEQICAAIGNGSAREEVLGRLQDLYVPTDAEYLYTNALSDC